MENICGIRLPGAVYWGEGALSKIPEILKEYERPVIFTDAALLKISEMEKIVQMLQCGRRKPYLITDIPSEPTYQQAQKTIDKFQKLGGDFIIAVGGGSVMDIAKLASILADGNYTVKDLLTKPLLAGKSVPSLFIPTTAGTGSESTYNSIVTVPETQVKVGIVNPAMLPDAVILDASMLRSLPFCVAASTGMDAMAHAVECFTSRKANIISDLYALEAARLIFGHIEKACLEKEAEEDRRQMQIGAFYAGLAINASGTTAVHALSYPLGGRYHIPHGVANAMLLSPVMRFNLSACSERLSKLYYRIRGEDADRLSTEQSAAEWVIERMEKLTDILKIPASLKEFGITKKDLDELVEAAMGVQRLLQNNCRVVTADIAREIYSSLL